VFVIQPATDDVQDNRIVWTCCKNNDGELGDRSAWERRNGSFIPVEDFEWETFDGTTGKAVVKPQILRELLERGREYDKQQIVTVVKEETGLAKSRAYQLVDQAKARGVLCYSKLTKIYVLA
jgi:hypothetical protein